MDHFYTQQKRQTHIIYERPKKEKLKLAWKNWKTDGKTMQKKNETPGQNIINTKNYWK